ncbi:MAG: hypothetical protein ACD_80C00166G0005 [uncultured bacterium (gcode 4)]|uniref:Uncharacterized protein n=1 Tax=uncultured bacterium (gcode 4) TaxID=1234023 RepID=K1YHA9_9BACT|nr:MAG: hypothetical protein ACD_80C00166G0005 [uncultured bacterium (gcode 4)]
MVGGETLNKNEKAPEINDTEQKAVETIKKGNPEAIKNAVKNNSALNAASKELTSNPSKDQINKVADKLTSSKLTSLSGVSAENILSLVNNITWKNDTKQLNDVIENIQKLSVAQKASLAYQLTVVKPLTSNEKNLLKANPVLLDTYNALNEWKEIGREINKDNISLLKNTLMNNRNTQMLSIYDSLFKSGEEVPLMPKNYSLATWDGSTTTGFLGKENLGRWAFDYGEKLSATNNSLSFWLEDGKPLNILLSPKWEDKGGWWKITLTMESPDKGQKYLIEWIYKNGKVTFSEDKVVPWDVVMNANSITIPNAYKDRKMSIATESNTFVNNKTPNNKNYDEINFNVGIDNGGLNLPAPTHMVNDSVAESAKPWIFELTKTEQEKVSPMLAKLNDAWNLTLKKDIPVNILVQADNMKFNDAPWSIKAGKEYYEKFLSNNKSNQKLCNIVSSFYDTIQKEPSVIANPDKLQQQAQKQLIVNRFVAIMEEVIKTPGFVNKINTWKFTINPSRENNNKRWVEITYWALSYIKA